MSCNVVFLSQNKKFVKLCTNALPAECFVTVLESLKSLKNCLEKLKSCVVLCDFEFFQGDETLTRIKEKNGHKLFFLTTRIQHCLKSSQSVVQFPFGFSRILTAIELNSQKEVKNSPLQKNILNQISGSSLFIKKLRAEILEASKFKEAVLITGESGTGKSLVAKILHCVSPEGLEGRKLVTENISAISPALIEAELFGCEAGAYTDLKSERNGLIGQAHKSSIFLDEIGDFPVSLQSKLLLAVQEGLIRKLGSDTSRYVDVRFIFATNRNLKERIEQGLFREDLFYRICATQIHIPPLRTHKEDIGDIATDFFKKKELNFSLAFQSLEKLKGYDWPGNVRELEHVLLRSARLCKQNIITPELIEL